MSLPQAADSKPRVSIGLPVYNGAVPTKAAVIINADGDQLSCYLDHRACDSADPVVQFGGRMRPADGMCNPVFGLVRREVMEQTCLHGDFMGTDRAFLAEIALHRRVQCIPDGLFLRRVHVPISAGKPQQDGSP